MSKEANRIIRQSTKEVKRAYKNRKSKASTISASQQRRWERAAELERRAEAIREGEQRKKKRKAEREKKEQRDKEARGRMGVSLPPRKGFHTLPRQMRISSLFQTETPASRKEADGNSCLVQLFQETSTRESLYSRNQILEILGPKQDTPTSDHPFTSYTVEDSYGLSDEDVIEAVAGYSTQRPAEGKENIPSLQCIPHTCEKATKQIPMTKPGDASNPTKENNTFSMKCDEMLKDEDILAAISSSGRLLEAPTPPTLRSGSRATADESVDLPAEEEEEEKLEKRKEREEESYGLSDSDPDFEKSVLELELL